MASAQEINVRTWTPSFSHQLVDISNAQFVASYCWFNPDPRNDQREVLNPTLVIPGCIPRLKTNLAFPLKTEADEVPCADSNRSQVPHKDLLKPLFLSVKLCQPEFQFTNMDVICDSSKLRHLTEWCEKPKAFNIDAEILGDRTMVLYAFENIKDYNRHNVNSFRKDFHSQTTSLPAGWESTFGNYRIISYRYGDLKMLVRSPQFVRNKVENEDPDVPQWTPESNGSFNGLKFIKSGKIESQENLAKFQYTAPRKGLKKREVWQKLYFSQIPLMFVADRGEVEGRTAEFGSLETLTAAKDFQCEISNAQPQRNKLLQLLDQMRNVLMEERTNGRSKLAFKFSKSRSVEVLVNRFTSQVDGWNCEITQDN